MHLLPAGTPHAPSLPSHKNEKPPTTHAISCPAPQQVRVSRLELPQSGLGVLSRLVCRVADYSRITVHLRLVGREGSRALSDTPYRLRKDGGALPGSPVFDLQPEHCNWEAVLDVTQGNEVLARCGTCDRGGGGLPACRSPQAGSAICAACQ